MEKLKVELGARSYEILIGADLLDKLPAALSQKKTYIVTDKKVAKLHLAKLQRVLDKAGIKHQTKILPSGEGTKSFAKLEELCGWLLAQKVERKTTIIAFGGGVIGDLVGFAASIVLRGINFIQVPTTLLAQVDSSVGGKTAINSKHGKNLVGSFYQPKLVLADIAVLKTLPKREFASGYAEVVKYGLINDAPFFKWLNENSIIQRHCEQGEAIQDGVRDVDCRASLAMTNLEKAIHKSCAAKAAIVSADEKEGGVRALLNFGHTFGHALEAETGFSSKLLHGEAVALGMIMAFEFSSQLGLCKHSEVDKVLEHFNSRGLPVAPHKYLKKWNVDKLIGHMKSDKKVKDGNMVFILTRGIGKAFIEEKVREKDLREFLRGYGK